MRITVIVSIVTFLLATSALAQVDPRPDGIGIYADLEATQVCVHAEPGEITPVYLLATNVSQPAGILTWAARIVVPPNAEILAWNIPGWSMNVAEPPEFVVARGQDPHPQAPIVLLMTFYVVVENEYPAFFYVTGAPLAGEGFDEAPVYLTPEDFVTPHWFHAYPNGLGQPVFAVNGNLTATETMTWGGVKSLFN